MWMTLHPENDTITREWTYSDICGNSETYIQTIITEDTEAPFIACTVTDTSCHSTNGINAFLGNYTATAATVDNCSSVTITQKPIPAAVINIGVIDVWLYATDDCGNVDSCSLSCVIGDTSILHLPAKIKNEFNIYPNPAKDKFNVHTPDWGGEVTLRISDLQGREVYKKTGLDSDNDYAIELKETDGIYLVEVFSGDKKLIRKLRLQ